MLEAGFNWPLQNGLRRHVEGQALPVPDNTTD
jgi:hypothetical protein